MRWVLEPTVVVAVLVFSMEQAGLRAHSRVLQVVVSKEQQGRRVSVEWGTFFVVGRAVQDQSQSDLQVAELEHWEAFFGVQQEEEGANFQVLVFREQLLVAQEVRVVLLEVVLELVAEAVQHRTKMDRPPSTVGAYLGQIFPRISYRPLLLLARLRWCVGAAAYYYSCVTRASQCCGECAIIALSLA